MDRQTDWRTDKQTSSINLPHLPSWHRADLHVCRPELGSHTKHYECRLVWNISPIHTVQQILRQHLSIISWTQVMGSTVTNGSVHLHLHQRFLLRHKSFSMRRSFFYFSAHELCELTLGVNGNVCLWVYVKLCSFVPIHKCQTQMQNAEEWVETHSLHLRLCHHWHSLNVDARVDIDTNGNVTCEGIRCVKIGSVVQ